MSRRLTKDQRRQQKKRKRLERRKRNAKKFRLKPWVVPKMKFFSMPKLLPDDVPKEKRLEIVRGIGDQAKARFSEKYPQLSAWFRNYDALYVLSFCAFYFSSQPEGIDPEVSGKLTFYHHYLEIMQAFALVEERLISGKPLLADAEKLQKELEEIGDAMQLRHLSIPAELTEDGDIEAYHLRTEMMAHTTAVRNWAYVHQMKKVALTLSGYVREGFQSIYGMDPTELLQLLFDLTEERNDLLNAHREKMHRCAKGRDHREMIREYNAAFPDNVQIAEAEADAIWEHAGRKRRNLLGMLLTHADMKLDAIYSFTLDHAQSLLRTRVPGEVLANVLDRLSYRFGDLKESNKEHFVLGNPVLGRPFIRVQDGNYFSAIWGIFPHIALELLEDLVWPHELLRNLYTEAKSSFLENEISRLLAGAFPSGQVHQGSLWTDPESGQSFENDVTVVLDTFAIVLEAKSGTVSDPAKRGAPKRLFETLRELIEEPSEQALRFVDYLRRHPQPHRFKTKRGTENVIDSRGIKYYIPLGITFAHLGMISSNLKKLIEAKVVEKKLEDLAPSMSFTDLEAVLELLPLEVEKIHYLARRREFEAHMDYEGDELDLLAFYLDNGFNIGDTEYARDVVMNMGLKSKELDPYFIGTNEGKSIPKPELAMTKWWKDLLQAISDRKTDAWTETGFILLNTTKEDQAKFEVMFKKLMTSVKKGEVEKLHNWVMFASGPERRRYLIAGYPYTTRDKEVRNGVMNEIISDQNFGKARGAVVIGVQADDLDYPYSVLARRASTELFDTLTLQ